MNAAEYEKKHKMDKKGPCVHFDPFTGKGDKKRGKLGEGIASTRKYWLSRESIRDKEGNAKAK